MDRLTFYACCQKVDDLLRVDLEDCRHLFYEQMKDFFFVLRDIRPEEEEEEEIDDAMLDLMTKWTDQ